MLAGLLADLSAEHYTWVATGDKRNPDATTVQSRADAFMARLRALCDQALILTLPDTYTGLTLQFLKETSYYRVGKSVQTFGIGGQNWIVAILHISCPRGTITLTINYPSDSTHIRLKNKNVRILG